MMRAQASKQPIDARLFAHPRLEIAALIAEQSGVSFRLLCSSLELSDGNLSAHLRALEDQAVVAVDRTFAGRRRLSRYRLTNEGRRRLRAYVRWLEAFARRLSPILARPSRSLDAAPASDAPSPKRRRPPARTAD
jgi:DNA-binding transcriptional ArsR family regulator